MEGSLDIAWENAPAPAESRIYKAMFAPRGSRGAVPNQWYLEGAASLRRCLVGLQDRENMEPGRPEYHAEQWMLELHSKGHLGLCPISLSEEQLAALSSGA